LNYFVLALVLLSASAAFAGDIHPSCELAKESILSQSSSGLPQVSNIGSIRIKCRIPARPFPTKPGEIRYGLRAETTAYQIEAKGAKEPVPSEANVTGGGFGPEPEEWVDFYVHIKLDSKELDEEARKFVAKMEATMMPDEKGQLPEGAHQKALENIRQLISVNRVGHFQLDCRVLDGSRVMGSDTVELEVLHKGSFSDGFPGSPPA